MSHGETAEQKERRKLAERLGRLLGAEAGRAAADALAMPPGDVATLAYNGRALSMAIEDALAVRERLCLYQAAASEARERVVGWLDRASEWRRRGEVPWADAFDREVAAEGEGTCLGAAFRNAEEAAHYEREAARCVP